MFETPILLITFNRPRHTAEVLAQIKKQQPKCLYVFMDGPRSTIPEDGEKCLAIRELIKKEVDWDCELKTLYEEKNLGCGYGPVKAISWFFKNEEQGIILEDDCVPNQWFFRFCEELLQKYKDNERIWVIGGTNRMGKWKSNSHSYFFTKYGNTIGWASWRRAWEKFDHNTPQWFSDEGRQRLRKIVGSNQLYKALEKEFDEHLIKERQKDVWDYHWHFIRLFFGGLSIVPSVNLVTNIGFGYEATHTVNPNDTYGNLPFYTIDFPLKHCEIETDKIYEWTSFQRFGNTNKRTLLERIILKAIRTFFKYM